MEINQMKYHVCTISLKLSRVHTESDDSNDYMVAEKSRIQCNKIGRVWAGFEHLNAWA